MSVRKAVDAGIRQVTVDINYVNAEHSFTFSCECKEHNLPHPGVLEYVDKKPVCMTCSKTRDQHPFPTNHELWNLFKAGTTQLRPDNTSILQTDLTSS